MLFGPVNGVVSFSRMTGKLVDEAVTNKTASTKRNLVKKMKACRVCSLSDFDTYGKNDLSVKNVLV
jgi:hypothetical protein